MLLFATAQAVVGATGEAYKEDRKLCDMPLGDLFKHDKCASYQKKIKPTDTAVYKVMQKVLKLLLPHLMEIVSSFSWLPLLKY